MNDWILVVDDDAANLRMASHILTAEGMRVSCLKSGEDALRFLQENRPDLILLDIHMPEMDGLTFVKAVRAKDEYKDLPILMITTEAAKEDILTALRSGVNNYVVKPFTPETLQEKVFKLLDL